MAVRFDEKKNLFTLQTLDSTYQMKVDDHGVLLHTYYGAAADETDFSYLIGPEDRGFSGQPGDEKKNRIMEKCGVPLLRMRTDGSGEREKIRDALQWFNLNLQVGDKNASGNRSQ